MTNRVLRVGEEVRRVLASILQETVWNDSVLDATPVTVTEVKMSRDLKYAYAYVRPLHGDSMQVMEALDAHKSIIRKYLGQSLSLKFTPNVRFHYDDTLDRVSRIDSLLDDHKG